MADRSLGTLPGFSGGSEMVVVQNVTVQQIVIGDSAESLCDSEKMLISCVSFSGRNRNSYVIIFSFNSSSQECG